MSAWQIARKRNEHLKSVGRTDIHWIVDKSGQLRLEPTTKPRSKLHDD
jgi:hypothetical protein